MDNSGRHVQCTCISWLYLLSSGPEYKVMNRVGMPINGLRLQSEGILCSTCNPVHKIQPINMSILPMPWQRIEAPFWPVSLDQTGVKHAQIKYGTMSSIMTAIKGLQVERLPGSSERLSESSQPQQSLRIATVNVKGLCSESKKQTLAFCLRKDSLDIVFLQETRHPPQEEQPDFGDVFEACGYKGLLYSPLCFCKRYSRSPRMSNLATFDPSSRHSGNLRLLQSLWKHLCVVQSIGAEVTQPRRQHLVTLCHQMLTQRRQIVL